MLACYAQSPGFNPQHCINQIEGCTPVISARGMSRYWGSRDQSHPPQHRVFDLGYVRLCPNMIKQRKNTIRNQPDLIFFFWSAFLDHKVKTSTSPHMGITTCQTSPTLCHTWWGIGGSQVCCFDDQSIMDSWSNIIDFVTLLGLWSWLLFLGLRNVVTVSTFLCWTPLVFS